MDLGLAPRVLARFSEDLGLVLASLREFEVLGGGVFCPIRFTINSPDSVPATTPARNSKMVISKLVPLLAQWYISVGLLRAIVADDSSAGSSSEVIRRKYFALAGGADNHALAHSP
jgi:hypothetical protein